MCKDLGVGQDLMEFTKIPMSEPFVLFLFLLFLLLLLFFAFFFYYYFLLFCFLLFFKKNAGIF
jgi:hypothetical protein